MILIPRQLYSLLHSQRIETGKNTSGEGSLLVETL